MLPNKVQIRDYLKLKLFIYDRWKIRRIERDKNSYKLDNETSVGESCKGSCPEPVLDSRGCTKQQRKYQFT